MLFSKIGFISIAITLYLASMCKGDIVKTLEKQYNQKPTKCFDKDKTLPPYMCSYLIIRGVRNIKKNSNSLKYAWSFKAENKKRKTFSASFLRIDSPIADFYSEYLSGMFLYPSLLTPEGMYIPTVYCAFPLDGHTISRDGPHGCGKVSAEYDPTGSSNTCSSHGIDTFPKWLDHYTKIKQRSESLVLSQCSFDMTAPNAHEAFDIVRQANAYIREHDEYSLRNNELVSSIWDEDNFMELPIQAFFYLLHSKLGLEEAVMYHKDLLKLTNGKRRVPIVGINLPTRQDYRMTFVEYFPEE